MDIGSGRPEDGVPGEWPGEGKSLVVLRPLFHPSPSMFSSRSYGATSTLAIVDQKSRRMSAVEGDGDAVIYCSGFLCLINLV
jgi:hypothetical protein